MEKKRIAVSGYYGFDNFGDEAILKVLVGELLARNYEVTVFSKSPNKTAETLGVHSVYTFDLKGILRTLKNTDVLFSGGGSLLQDVTSLKSLFYYLFVIGLALFFRKDVIVFAQGIGPINNFYGAFLTRILLKQCKYITVRDVRSFNLLQNWGLSPVLVSDPVWGLNLKDRCPYGRVGIQLRSWKNLSEEYLLKLAKKIALNFSDKEIYIYSFQDSLDYELCCDFERKLRDVTPDLRTRVLYNLNIDEILESFSQLDYLIGMRFHACLLALKYGVPTMALSYDTKVEKLAEMFAIPCSKLDKDECFEQLIKKMIELDSQRIVSQAQDNKFDFSKFVDVIEK